MISVGVGNCTGVSRIASWDGVVSAAAERLAARQAPQRPAMCLAARRSARSPHRRSANTSARSGTRAATPARASTGTRQISPSRSVAQTRQRVRDASAYVQLSARGGRAGCTRSASRTLSSAGVQLGPAWRRALAGPRDEQHVRGLAASRSKRARSASRRRRRTRLRTTALPTRPLTVMPTRARSRSLGATYSTSKWMRPAARRSVADAPKVGGVRSRCSRFTMRHAGAAHAAAG